MERYSSTIPPLIPIFEPEISNYQLPRSTELPLPAISRVETNVSDDRNLQYTSNEEQSSDETIMCNICKGDFNCDIELMKHLVSNIKTHEKSMKFPLSCIMCPKILLTSKYFTAHFLDHIRNETKTCNICKMTFSTGNDLNIHNYYNHHTSHIQSRTTNNVVDTEKEDCNAVVDNLHSDPSEDHVNTNQGDSNENAIETVELQLVTTVSDNHITTESVLPTNNQFNNELNSITQNLPVLYQPHETEISHISVLRSERHIEKTINSTESVKHLNNGNGEKYNNNVSNNMPSEQVSSYENISQSLLRPECGEQCKATISTNNDECTTQQLNNIAACEIPAAMSNLNATTSTGESESVIQKTRESHSNSRLTKSVMCDLCGRFYSSRPSMLQHRGNNKCLTGRNAPRRDRKRSEQPQQEKPRNEDSSTTSYFDGQYFIFQSHTTSNEQFFECTTSQTPCIDPALYVGGTATVNDTQVDSETTVGLKDAKDLSSFFKIEFSEEEEFQDEIVELPETSRTPVASPVSPTNCHADSDQMEVRNKIQSLIPADVLKDLTITSCREDNVQLAATQGQSYPDTMKLCESSSSSKLCETSKVSETPVSLASTITSEQQLRAAITTLPEPNSDIETLIQVPESVTNEDLLISSENQLPCLETDISNDSVVLIDECSREHCDLNTKSANFDPIRENMNSVENVKLADIEIVNVLSTFKANERLNSNITKKESPTVVNKNKKKRKRRIFSVKKKIKNKNNNKFLSNEENADFSCPYCFLICKGKNNFMEHIGVKKFHTSCSKYNIKKGDSYSCAFCDFNVQNKSKLLNHLFSHRKTRKYSCAMCPDNSEFVFLCMLNRHQEKLNHGRQDLWCSRCDIQFLNQDSINLHEETHHSVS